MKSMLKLSLITLTFFFVVSTHLSSQIPFNDVVQTLTKGEVYGDYCGIAAEQPPLRISIEELIKNENIEAIRSWLDSPSWVHQTYAAEALIRLSNKDIQLTEDEVIKINELKLSTLKISACKGCMYGDVTIAKALENFDL